MKLDAKSGADLRAYIKALYGLADPKPAPVVVAATIVFTIHPPQPKG